MTVTMFFFAVHSLIGTGITLNEIEAWAESFENGFMDSDPCYLLDGRLAYGVIVPEHVSFERFGVSYINTIDDIRERLVDRPKGIDGRPV